MFKAMLGTVAVAMLVASAGFADTAFAASLFGSKASAQQTVSDAALAQIQAALDEQRYVDAAQLLNQALLILPEEPKLVVLVAELNLARGRYSDALATFKTIETKGPVRARALQGEGLTLSLLGRSDEALGMLQAAVREDPSQWRAWNGIATEFDRRGDWSEAETAYDHALVNSNRMAVVLNNRGFSRLLQNRYDDATVDFVAALDKKRDFAAARNNLRLAIAMKGDYERSVAAGGRDSDAALLNNAGFAAMLRGDYAQAESLFEKAIKAKGEYYARASENLQMARDLKARKPSSPGAGVANH
jgi:Flp pilus assembly protein TadD